MTVALLVFAGVVISAAGTYLIARRTSSGRIDTSEAAKLWDESTAMRHELREQVETLTVEIVRLKTEHRSRIDVLDVEVARLRHRIVELEARIVKASDG